MEGKKMRAAVLTEGVAQAVLRRGSARELDSEEEKVMRMRLGAGLPSSGKLERVGKGFTDTEIELLSYEIESWLKLRDQVGQSRVSQPVPVASRAKEKIIRALRRKS
jgi:hypothetical protein